MKRGTPDHPKMLADGYEQARCPGCGLYVIWWRFNRLDQGPRSGNPGYTGPPSDGEGE